MSETYSKQVLGVRFGTRSTESLNMTVVLFRRTVANEPIQSDEGRTKRNQKSAFPITERAGRPDDGLASGLTAEPDNQKGEVRSPSV